MEEVGPFADAHDPRLFGTIEPATTHPALLDALERAQFGVIITAHAQPPAFLNEYARRFLNRCDGLRIVQGEFETIRASDTKVLREAIRRACRRELTSCVTLMLPRGDEARPFAVHVPAVAYSAVGTNLATIFVCDPNDEQRVSESALTRLYALTRSEANFAILLMRGKTVEQAAEHLFISIHTARTHLKRILLKTDTIRQAELLRLLLTCTAQVRID